MLERSDTRHFEACSFLRLLSRIIAVKKSGANVSLIFFFKSKEKRNSFGNSEFQIVVHLLEQLKKIIANHA